MSKANITVKVYSNEEAWEEAANLKKYGYTKIGDCYWFQYWEKNGWVVEIERA